MKRVRAAFTLIELLVVIGIIGVLAAVLGMSLGRGNSGTALQGAQSISSSLIGGARAQAAAAVQDGAVVINVSPTSENFLRELYVVTNDGTNWVARGEPTYLPSGVYFVPESSAFGSTNVSFGGAVAWTATVRSSAFSVAAFKVKATNSSTDISPDDYRIIARFTPRGTTGSGYLSTIVFSPAERTSDIKLEFNNASAVRGITLSNYGVTTFLNDAEAF